MLSEREKALEVVKVLTKEEKAAFDELFRWRFKINSTLLAISATMLSVNAAISKLFETRSANSIIPDCNIPLSFDSSSNQALFSVLAWGANILCILALVVLVCEHIYVNSHYIEDIRKEKRKEISELVQIYEKGYILQFQKRLKIFSILDYVAYFSFFVFVLMLSIMFFI